MSPLTLLLRSIKSRENCRKTWPGDPWGGEAIILELTILDFFGDAFCMFTNRTDSIFCTVLTLPQAVNMRPEWNDRIKDNAFALSPEEVIRRKRAFVSKHNGECCFTMMLKTLLP